MCHTRSIWQKDSSLPAARGGVFSLDMLFFQSGSTSMFVYIVVCQAHLALVFLPMLLIDRLYSCETVQLLYSPTG